MRVWEQLNRAGGAGSRRYIICVAACLVLPPRRARERLQRRESTILQTEYRLHSQAIWQRVTIWFSFPQQGCSVHNTGPPCSPARPHLPRTRSGGTVRDVHHIPCVVGSRALRSRGSLATLRFMIALVWCTYMQLRC